MINNDDIFLNKENTLTLKGIALILMFAHHFFTFPNWIISGITYPYMTPFSYAFKICVPIYAFITGYIYVQNGEKNIKYSIKKITNILLYYWFIYTIFLIINFILGNTLSIIEIIKEIFIIDMPIICFGWYIRFYCISMLILPLLCKFESKRITLDIIYFLIFPIIISTILFAFFKTNSALSQIINEMLYYFPCICIGLIFGKYSIFNKIKKIFNYNKSIININIPIIDIIVSLYIVLIVFFIRNILPIINFKIYNYNFVINLDIIYIPIFIYYLTYFIKQIKYKPVLVSLGKYSLLMWLTHSIFFNACKKFFQPILYIFKEPLLVLLWGLFICYIMSVIFEKLIEKIFKLKT